MTWIYTPEGFDTSPCSPAQAGESTPQNYSDGKLSATSSTTTTASESSEPESETASSATRRSGTMSGPSTGGHGEGSLTFSAQGSRVSPSVQQGRGAPPMTSATDGLIPFASFERSALGSRCWKTSQGSLLHLMGTSAPSSVTWPRAGTMRNGVCFLRPDLERRTSESDCGSLLPTPVVSRADSNQGGAAGRVGKVRYSLDGLAKRGMLPTPTAHDSKDTAPPSERTRTTPSLLTQLLPTPTASDGTKGSGTSSKRQGSMSLTAKLLPTPIASDGTKGSRKYARGNPTLIGARLPTPTASDANGSGSRDYPQTATRNAGTTLTDATVRLDAPGERGRLNPCFVEWMQDWPIGATDLQPLATGRLAAWLSRHGICSEDRDE